jgi:hypothetical protein
MGDSKNMRVETRLEVEVDLGAWTATTAGFGWGKALL